MASALWGSLGNSEGSEIVQADVHAIIIVSHYCTFQQVSSYLLNSLAPNC